MKRLSFGLVMLFSAVLLSCKSHADEEQLKKEAEESVNEIFDELLNEGTTSADCDAFTIADFDTYLGLSYGDKEEKVREVLGKETESKYTEDRSRFMYFYKDTKRVPVTIYVNAKSGEVETVFMEILGLNQNFEQDVLKAEEDFGVEACIIELFGKKPKEILTMFGQAGSDNMKESANEQGVRTLNYYSEDGGIMVTFKFYPSQENKLSSIEVNWFYGTDKES
ncbi:MAG: hypothetical protein ACWA41_05875 [Putridiphycobacter sp.]